MLGTIAIRSSLSQIFFKIDVLKDFSKFTRKDLFLKTPPLAASVQSLGIYSYHISPLLKLLIIDV